MNVAFLLPNYSGKVVGSLLVYYRFAEQLAKAGHRVDVFHPGLWMDPPSIWHRVRSSLWAALKNRSRNPIPWIALPERVKPRFRPRLDGLVLDHDRVVAFSWKSIESLGRIRTSGKAFGYIVEYETWAEASPAAKARMEAAYRLRLPLLCSSAAVESMLREVGALDIRPCVHGIDSRIVPAKCPRSDGHPIRIGFPVRMEAVKSPAILESTLRLLKNRFGDRVVLWGFGNHAVPQGFLDLLDEYHSAPSNQKLSELYGESDIFGVPSRKEGFGMPAAEAMTHGCAVVSTDNGGIRTFGVHGRNCLIVPPESGPALSEAIASLVEDPVRRAELAMAAPESVEFLRWEHAGDRLLRSIEVV